MTKAERLRQALLTLEEEGILPTGEADKAIHTITHGREYYLVLNEQVPPQVTAALALQAHKIEYDE